LKKHKIIPANQEVPKACMITTDQNPPIDGIRMVTKQTDTKHSDDKEVYTSQVVIANFQQLIDNGLRDHFPRGFFDLIIIDEGHHASAPSYLAIQRYFRLARFVLLTATPFLANQMPIQGKVIFKFPIMDAIKDKYIKNILLEPLKVRKIEYQDGAGPMNYMSEKKSLVAKEIAEKTGTKFLRQIANQDVAYRDVMKAAMMRLRELRVVSGVHHQAICWASTKEDAQHLTELWKTHPDNQGDKAFKVNCVFGEDNNKATKIEQFLAGQIDIMIQVQLLGEGFDHPRLSVAVFFKRPASLGPFMQFVGRIMRKNKHPQNPSLELPEEADQRGYIIFHPGFDLYPLWEAFQKEDPKFEVKKIRGSVKNFTLAIHEIDWANQKPQASYYQPGVSKSEPPNLIHEFESGSGSDSESEDADFEPEVIGQVVNPNAMEVDPKPAQPPPKTKPDLDLTFSTVAKENEQNSFIIKIKNGETSFDDDNVEPPKIRLDLRNFFGSTQPDVKITKQDQWSYHCSYIPTRYGKLTITVTLQHQHQHSLTRTVQVFRDFNKVGIPVPIPCISKAKAQTKPFGVKMLGEEEIVISSVDSDDIQIHKFKPMTRGSVTESVGSNRFISKGENQFKNCRGLDILSTGEIVVANHALSICMLIDSNGNVNPFGKTGSGDGEFKRPRGVLALPDDDLVICDTDNSRVQIFRRDKFDKSKWNHLRTIGNKSPNSEDNLLYCLGVAYNKKKKELAVTDTDNHRVLFYDLNGNPKGKIADVGFVKPAGIGYDDANNLYVTDMDGHKLRIFDPNNKLIKTVGKGKGLGNEQMDGPRMLTIAWDGSIVIADLENHRVLVF